MSGVYYFNAEPKRSRAAPCACMRSKARRAKTSSISSRREQPAGFPRVGAARGVADQLSVEKVHRFAFCHKLLGPWQEARDIGVTR